MTSIQLKYGRGTISCTLPDEQPVQWIYPPSVSPAPDPALLVKQSLLHPSGEICEHKLTSDTRVAIAVNDKTRPVPHPVLLPPLLEWLHSHGVPDENITFFIASGTHVPMEPGEFSQVLPESLTEKYPIIAHDCQDKSNLTYLGQTACNQTPVWVNTRFYQSGYRIVVGNIEPHHFMGFSGGVKTASIGLTGLETIQKNHALMIDPGCETARVIDNPMRKDVEEIGQMIGVDLAVNAVLNEKREIVRVLSGEPASVFADGITSSREVSQMSVSTPFSLVIASAGGYPKDINFYQAQKAMTNAALVVRDNGVLILAAEYIEGAGSKGFTDFMYNTASPAEVLVKFAASSFAIGMHKAFLTCRILDRIKVILVSSLEPSLVRSWHMLPAPTLQDAVTLAFDDFPQGNKPLAVMPYAVNTVPLVQLP